mgnify:CR=1 FL=1
MLSNAVEDAVDCFPEALWVVGVGCDKIGKVSFFGTGDEFMVAIC